MKNAFYIIGSLFIAILLHGIALAEWQTSIKIAGKDTGGMTNGEVIIGEAVKADSKPAPPNAPEFSCKIAIPSTDWKSSNAVDIREEDGSSKTWILAINPFGNATQADKSTVQVSWNTESLGDGNFELREGWKGDGPVLIPDMKAVSNFKVSGSENADQYFTIVQF